MERIFDPAGIIESSELQAVRKSKTCMAVTDHTHQRGSYAVKIYCSQRVRQTVFRIIKRCQKFFLSYDRIDVGMYLAQGILQCVEIERCLLTAEPDRSILATKTHRRILVKHFRNPYYPRDCRIARSRDHDEISRLIYIEPGNIDRVNIGDKSDCAGRGFK